MAVAQAANREQSTYWQGIALVGAFVLLSSAREVYVGHLVQRMDPFALVSVCFLVATAFFLALHAASASAGGPGYFASIRAHFRDVLALNLVTAAAWLGGFLALRYIEPSIENSIVTSVGPAITILAGVPMGPRRAILRTEKLTSAGILVVIAFMAAISLLNKSGVGHVAPADVLLGIFFCLVSGAAVVGNTIYSKRLFMAGLPTSFVIAVRFHLLIVVSLVMAARGPASLDLLHANLAGILVLATVGITLPLYLLQKGIERSEPITVSFILVLAPAFVYLFQVFDARLSWSLFTLVGITAVMLLVLVSLMARARSLR